MSPPTEDVWINRPSATEHNFPWKDPPAGQNPVVRGLPLHLGAIAISNLNFLQSFLWQNAGFSSLRERKELEDAEPRYDPTVIKIAAHEGESFDMLAEDWTGKRKNVRVHHSVLDYHEAYLSGKITPTDVAKALLPLITKNKKHKTAFLQVREDLVLQAAEESTKRFKEGRVLSLIDGVPVAVKDEVDVTGYTKCYGSKLDFTRKDDATSFCVKKWQEAGAVLMGKTLMHELGADTTNNNPNFGTPLNPNNENYYCGGSSGGSAYAVASGLLPLTEGNDGGGSIRIPSNYCGLYGLKTSHGRVSKRPSVNLARSTGVCGPMAASMLDLEIGYRIMAQADASDPDSKLFKTPGPISLSTNRRKVLGIYNPWFNRADPIVKSTCQKVLNYLTSHCGYQQIEISLPLLPEGQLAHALTILSELSTGVPLSSIPSLTAANKVLLSVARHTTALDFLQAQRLRELLMQHLSHLYSTHPDLIIVTPTTPNAGWRIEAGDLSHGLTNGNKQLRNMEYAWLANFTGCPAISAPCGFTEPEAREVKDVATEDGQIPLGIMGMAEWCNEDDLIAFGYDVEKYLAEEYPGGRVEPVNWTDVLELAAVSPKSA